MISLIVITLNALAIAMIAAVIGLHFQAWRRSPRGMGILPLHVMLVSASQIIFMVLAADQILPPAGHDEWTWQFGAFLTANLMTIGSLIAVGEFQRRRLICRAKEEIRDQHPD